MLAATVTHTDGVVAEITSYRGTTRYNGSGTLGNVLLYDGTLSFADNDSIAVTVTTVEHYDGEPHERSGLGNVAVGTYNTHGGGTRKT